jgi:microcystin-dependent protein
MSSPYVGELRLVGYNFAPAGWQFCNGQLLPISQYNVLFNLIGTTYGGDGQTTFALPDLRGRVPVHQGTSTQGAVYVMGQVSGSENVTITSSTYPTHTHALLESTNNTGATSNPLGQAVGGVKIYVAQTPATPMSSQMVSTYAGGNQPHSNIQPFQVLNWIIAMDGIYPSRG